VDLLDSWNVKPKAVIGHSSGEIAAVYAAGLVSREDAWRLAFFRGKISATANVGAMIAVGLPLKDAEAYLSEVPDVQIACVNSPRNVTLSGTEQAVQALHEVLEKEGVFNRVLNVRVAYHSKHMQGLAADYLALIKDVNILPGSENCPLFSTVTGRQIKSAELKPSYFVDNLVSPVRFSETLASLYKTSSPDCIVEIGPHSALQSVIKDTISSTSSAVPLYVSTLVRGKQSNTTLLQALGQLWSRGCPINLKAINNPTKSPVKCLSTLKPYSWNHQRSYWFESQRSRGQRLRKFPRSDLLGAPDVASNNISMCWRNFLSTKELPWLLDHRVQGVTLYPAAGMLIMAVEAARQIEADAKDVAGFQLSDVRINRAMVIPDGGFGLETLFTLNSTRRKDCYDFVICSRSTDDLWQENCRGSMVVCRKFVNDVQEISTLTEGEVSQDSGKASAKLPPHNNTRKMYQNMASLGMCWGPSFQNLINIQLSNNGNRSFAVQIPNTAQTMPGQHEYPHLIHPATLDALFHSIVFAESQHDRAPKVPNSIGHVYISNSTPCIPGTILTGTAETRDIGLRAIAGKVVASASEGTAPLVVIDDLICADIGSADSGDVDDGSRRTLCTRNVWKEDMHLLTAEQLLQVEGYDSALAKVMVLASFRDPGTRMLVVCEDGVNVRQDVVSVLASVVEEGLIVAQITFAMIDAGDKEEFLKEITKFGPACSVRDFDAKQSLSDQSFETSLYDVVFVHGRQPDELQAELQTLVRPGGRFISEAALVDPELREGSETPLADLLIVQAERMTSFEGLLQPLRRKLSKAFVCEVKPLGELESGDTSGKIVLVLADLERHGVADWSPQEYHNLQRVLLRNKRLLWVTRGATTMNGGNPGAASVMGLLRSLRFEDSSLKLYSLDLATNDEADNSYPVDNIDRLLQKITHNDSYLLEYEFAESNGRIYIPRVLPEDDMSSTVTNNLEGRISNQALKSFDANFEAIVEHPGSLESIRFIETEATPELPDDHVQIRVMATSVRRSDALTALGQTDKTSLGASTAGTIITIGRHVDDTLLGTRVAVTQPGCIKNHITCAADSVYPLPNTISFPQAAVATWDYATAHYALCELAKLGWSEKCLIFDPCSALGQGAVQIARYCGAEVFVIANDPETRAFATDVLGVPSSNIVDPTARTEGLKGDGLRWDVMLCTEGGDEYTSCWRSMEDFGRLICVGEGFIQESGKSENLSRHPSANFITINAALVQKKRPHIWQRAVEEVFLLLGEESIRPPQNVATFRFSQITDAFKTAADTNTVLVALETEDDDVVPIVRHEKHPLHNYIRPDATYLMIGGLGGLGRSIASMLVAHGAKHIAFASRSSANEDAKVFLSSLQTQGATNAIALICDIADAAQLQNLLATDLKSLPPIRGVINAAMVLRDQLFENMSREDFQAVLRPKVQGSWNLHDHLPHDLDFFILLSSIAGVGGMRGQTAYAAANAFQDALAHERHRLGLRATALDLTVVLGIGVVAENPELLSGLHQAGVLTIREDELHRLLKSAITGFSPLGDEDHATPAQVIVGVASGGHLDRHDIQDSMWPNDNRFKHTLCLGREALEHSSAAGTVATRLDALLSGARDLPEASAVILTALVEKLARALSVPVEEIEASRCVSDYGVDSLLAVELRNWIQRKAKATVSIFDLMSPVPIRVLAGKIARESGFVKEAVKIEG
jgi:acyl transferase domain-containing protein/NADPH:quinone reductase-like Zn-dependent oxidoreductase